MIYTKEVPNSQKQLKRCSDSLASIIIKESDHKHEQQIAALKETIAALEAEVAIYRPFFKNYPVENKNAKFSVRNTVSRIRNFFLRIWT